MQRKWCHKVLEQSLAQLEVSLALTICESLALFFSSS